jgi:hypothetical protein
MDWGLEMEGATGEQEEETMRTFCAVLLLSVVAAGVGLAQVTAPQPGAEYQRLTTLAGTWQGGGAIYATPLSAAGKLTLTNACTVFPGGYNLVCDATGTMLGQPYRELQVLGYDPEARQYTWYDIDNTGMNSLGHGSFSQSTWTFVFDVKANGKPARMRVFITLLSPTTAECTADVSVDGGPPMKMQDAKLEKVK